MNALSHATQETEVPKARKQGTFLISSHVVLDAILERRYFRGVVTILYVLFKLGSQVMSHPCQCVHVHAT